MPSIFSLIGKPGKVTDVPLPQGMQVVPIESPRPRAQSPALPPDLTPDLFTDDVMADLDLAPPELDSGTGEGRAEEGSSQAGRRPPVPLTVPWLRYPADAIRDQVSGVVVLRVLVGVDGRVEEVQVLEGLRPDCNRAAVDAARGLVFQPAEESGQRVRAWTDVEITFDLGRS
jgi:protein TonB